MYIGCARNFGDVARASELAAKIFRANESQDAAVDIKKHLLAPAGSISEQDVVILANENNDIIGACFLIDRLFFRRGRKLKGTFLTSICVAESSRGKGLSAPLMDCAIAECERRGSAFAILIARRAVDYFYRKFNFWGLSQYSKINISLKDVSASTKRLAIHPATEEDLASVDCLYESTYSTLLGSCQRPIEYWRHVLWKTAEQRNSFVIFRLQGAICGYAILSGDEVHELASTSDILCLDLLHRLGETYLQNKFVLSCSPRHRIVEELWNWDFSITIRQCVYGGHMVRIIDYKLLANILEEELGGMLRDVRSTDYIERSEDLLIEFREGKATVNIISSPFTYRNTCNLMGARCLSESPAFESVLSPQSFNVPLVDQL